MDKAPQNSNEVTNTSIWFVILGAFLTLIVYGAFLLGASLALYLSYSQVLVPVFHAPAMTFLQTALLVGGILLAKVLIEKY